MNEGFNEGVQEAVVQNALMKIYIDTNNRPEEYLTTNTPRPRRVGDYTARSATHSSSSSPTSAACATTSSPMMMPLSKFPLIATRRPLTTADSVEESAHRHLAHLLLHQEQAVCLARGVYLGAQHVGRIQDVCTRGRQIPLQSISKLRAARNVCLVHLSQHQAAVGAACKAMHLDAHMQGKGTHRAHKEFRLAQICALHIIVNPDEHGLVDKDRKKEEAASVSLS